MTNILLLIALIMITTNSIVLALMIRILGELEIDLNKIWNYITNL